MGRSPNFVAPDLSGILDQAKRENKWSAADAKQAKEWYEHFLELNWETPGIQIVVMNAKADQLWHTHIIYTARYRNYCVAVFGYYLDHTPNDQPTRKPTAAEQAAANKAYAAWGAIPDAIVKCTTIQQGGSG